MEIKQIIDDISSSYKYLDFIIFYAYMLGGFSNLWHKKCTSI